MSTNDVDGHSDKFGIWMDAADGQPSWWLCLVINGVARPFAWDREYAEERLSAMQPEYKNRGSVRAIPLSDLDGRPY